MSAAFAVGAPAQAQDLLRFGVGQVRLGWTPPDTGLIDGYVVLVARNDGPEQVVGVIDAPEVWLHGTPGDRLVVRVRALGRVAPGGTLLASAPSPPSTGIRFLPAPGWPGDGLLALQCTRCPAVQLRVLSNRVAPVEIPGPPAPWRLLAVGDFHDAPGLEPLWRHDGDGALHVSPLGGDLFPGLAGAPGGDLARAVAVLHAELDGDRLREIVVQDAASARIGFWETAGDTIVPVGEIFASTTWRLAAARDFDGDGRSELFFAGDAPGRLVVWKVGLDRILDVLADIDTGASGALAEVADFDGDGTLDALYRDDDGALTIAFLDAEGGGPTPGAGHASARLRELRVLPGVGSDGFLRVAGAVELDATPGAEILLQHRGTRRVLAVFVAAHGAPRHVLFDHQEPFDLVHVDRAR